MFADRRSRGFTLVECAVVCALSGVLVTMAVPSWRGSVQRATRLDAVAALTRLQAAQEQYRSLSGLYAGDFRTLRGTSAVSAQGAYALSLDSTGPDSYRATASALGAQRQDSACASLTLEVSQGFAHFGPSAACWNR